MSRKPDPFSFRVKRFIASALMYSGFVTLAVVAVPILLTIDNMVYAPWTKKGKALRQLHAQ